MEEKDTYFIRFSPEHIPALEQGEWYVEESELKQFFDEHISTIEDFAPAARRFKNKTQATLAVIRTFVVELKSSENEFLKAAEGLENEIELIEKVPPEPDFMTASCNLPDDYTSESAVNRWRLDNCSVSEAWCLTSGSSDIGIGITELTYDLPHPELDDNVIYLDGNVLAFDPSLSNAMHGTHVAGCASGVTNNGLSVASVGYNSSLMLYPGTYDGMCQAAADGAKVVNASRGISSYSTTLQTTVTGIYDQGVVIVASAGNGAHGEWKQVNGFLCPGQTFDQCYDGVMNGSLSQTPCEGSFFLSGKCKFYPASYDHVISVTGVNNIDEYEYYNVPYSQLLSFETYNMNSEVDISAPAFEVNAITRNNAVQTLLNGTSFAAPMVAGAAALIFSVDKDFTPDEVEQFLLLNTDDIFGNGNNALYSGVGTGRLNVESAVEAAILSRIPDFDPCVGNLVNSENNMCSGLLYVTAENEGIINSCEGVQLEAEMTHSNSQCSYKWSPKEGLSNGFIANPVANPDASTLYTLTVTENRPDGNYCSWVSQVYVENISACSQACDDGIKNYGETGIDCGGPCPPCAGGGVSQPWNPCFSARTYLNPPLFSNSVDWIIELSRKQLCIVSVQGEFSIAGRVSLNIYNAFSGELVEEVGDAELFPELLEEYKNVITFDSTAWPKGIYIFELKVNDLSYLAKGIKIN